MSKTLIMKLQNNWSVKRFIPAKTDNIMSTFFHGKKKAETKKLESPKSKVYAGYVLMKHEIKNINAWVEIKHSIINKHDDLKELATVGYKWDLVSHEHIQAIFIAIISTYGKLFSNAEGRRVKLERTQIPSEFLKIHDHLIKLRDKYTAHSGDSEIESCVPILVYCRKQDKVIGMIDHDIIQPAGMKFDDSFIKLINHIDAFLEQKIETIKRKIIDDELPLLRSQFKEKSTP